MVTKETENLYNDYLSQSDSRWEYGNSILYRMCKEEPKHKEIDAIVGKVWLIGRSYAAAIERRKNAVDDNDDFYYDVVAPKMLEIGSELDDRITRLQESTGHIVDDVEEILSTHKFLTDIFGKMTGLKKRSLASKYLHFHCPEKFFIYDSRARKSIEKLVKGSDKKFLVNVSDYDQEYGYFVCRMLELQEYLYEKLGTYEMPRSIDSFLLWTLKKKK